MCNNMNWIFEPQPMTNKTFQNLFISALTFEFESKLEIVTQIWITQITTMIPRNEKDAINNNCTYYIVLRNNNIRIKTNCLSLFNVSSLAPPCNVSLAPGDFTIYKKVVSRAFMTSFINPLYIYFLIFQRPFCKRKINKNTPYCQYIIYNHSF